MKKFAKMSLVAAIAVAGTVASAQPLAEAIANVDVSGTVVYRYNDLKYDDDSNAKNNSDNNYKIGVTLKSKVTDDVTFNSRILMDNGWGDALGTTSDNADGNVELELSWANFAYTGIANTTVVVGKQGLATPWTRAIDSDGSEQTGTGILAMTTMGPVTAAGGYFNQTNISTTMYGDTLDAGANLMVAAVMGSFGPVKAEAWYLDIDEGMSQYFVKVAGAVGPVKMFAQYSDYDGETNTNLNDDVNLLKVGVSGKMGMFNAGITYAKSGNEGTGILNSVAPSVSAIGYSVNLNGADNADAFFVDLGAQVTDKLHIGLNYDRVSDDDADNADDHDETFVQFTYNHAKNLSTYVRLATGEDAEEDYNRGRLQIEYKF